MTTPVERQLTFAVSTHDWYDTYEYGWWEEDIPMETKRTLFKGDILQVQPWFELTEHIKVRPRDDGIVTPHLSPSGGRPNLYRYVAKVQKNHQWKNIDSLRRSLGIEEHWELLLDCGFPIVVDIVRTGGARGKAIPPDGSIIEGEANLQANLCLWDGYLHRPVKGRLVDVVPAELHNGRPIAHAMTVDLVSEGVPAHSITWSNPDKRVFDTGEAIPVRCPSCGGSRGTRAWMGETRRKKGVLCPECLKWSRTIR